MDFYLTDRANFHGIAIFIGGSHSYAILPNGECVRVANVDVVEECGHLYGYGHTPWAIETPEQGLAAIVTYWATEKGHLALSEGTTLEDFFSQIEQYALTALNNK